MSTIEKESKAKRQDGTTPILTVVTNAYSHLNELRTFILFFGNVDETLHHS